MLFFPEEQPVNHYARPFPHAVHIPSVGAGGQTFVAISAYDCVEKLVYSNQHVFDVLSSRNFHVFPPKMSFMQANDTLNFFAISFLVHFPRRFFICMTCSSVSFAELFFSPLFPCQAKYTRAQWPLRPRVFQRILPYLHISDAAQCNNLRPRQKRRP